VTITTDQFRECERAFWRVAAARPTSDERTQHADDAFWATMVRLFPEVKVGELDPLTTGRLGEAERHAVTEWDKDGLQPETASALSELMRAAANEWLYYGHPANQFEE
jgi:hypothetical protein